MRFLFTIIIWFVFVGGLWLYTQQRDSGLVNTVQPVIDHSVTGLFAVEVTTTFDVEADPFALQTDDVPAAEMELRLNGRQIILPDDPVSRGVVIRVDNVDGVLEGHNDIYISASPPVSEAMLEQGVRIKFFADDNIIVDHTAWSGNGAVVSTSFGFEYSKTGGDEHEHH